MQRISDDDFAQTKFFKIAQEMNKGWIVDFSVTHKAYKDEREALILNQPKKLAIKEWEEMISCFETEDF